MIRAILDVPMKPPTPSFSLRLACAALLATFAMTQGLSAQNLLVAPNTDLTELSLQDLMKIEITSVSKRAQPLSDAAASIFVITRDDIRRSGATSLPEALRLAPNLEVARASAYGYAISARGFNDSSTNKLLVLIDGRSIYTPLFGGVFWDVQDLMLEDIERIEVISGPGGTLWGTNAVNGVINIITRTADATQGQLVSAGAGTRESNAAIRHGGTIGTNGRYRVYARYYDGHDTETAAGSAKDDSINRLQVGFRSDWRRGSDELTFLGNAYRGTEGQPLPGTVVLEGIELDLGIIPLSGVNLLGRWKRPLQNGDVTVQAYYDRTERTVPPTFAETLDIFDVQIQHTTQLGSRHSFSWGGGYRQSHDELANGVIFGFLPADLTQKWVSGFAQDEIALSDRLRATAGLRIEHNDYTGRELLPNVRLAWKQNDAHLFWGAASRAVRAPARLDRDAFVPSSPPFLLAGGADVRSEIGNVFELGYRGQAAAAVTLSATAFHTVWDHLRTQELAPSQTHYIFGSGMEGTTTGVEVWASYQPTTWWRVTGGFRGLHQDLTIKDWSNDAAAVANQEGRDPARTWRLRSSFDVSKRGEVDVMLRHVSELSLPVVPSYTAMDVRFGWRVRPDLELSLTGQNLLGDGHGEFTDVTYRTELRRGVFFKLVKTFGE